jgi:hypothetical protein
LRLMADPDQDLVESSPTNLPPTPTPKVPTPDEDLVQVPNYARVYVDQVIGEYDALHNVNPNLTVDDQLQEQTVDQLAQQLICDYRSGKPITWGRLYSLERMLALLAPVEALRARVPYLRARYTALSGTAGPQVPVFDATAQASVLAYVESLLREVNRLQAVNACRERLRKRRLLRLIVFIGATVLVLFIMFVTVAAFSQGFDWKRKVLCLMVVPFIGALGGMISSQRHVQSIPGVGESLADLTNLYFWGSSLTASAMSGAVFAAVLFMLFAGGLLSGALFPNVSGADLFPQATGGGFRVSAVEFGKLSIWSFVAGYAGQFVPHILDNLVSKSAKEQ